MKPAFSEQVKKRGNSLFARRVRRQYNRRLGAEDCRWGSKECGLANNPQPLLNDGPSTVCGWA